ncbi:alkaline phosphatase D family protein [Halocatena halophila]|uniref:alkaline phosphatase D family protein n=1 Tax=Halocatena halophila TaxID=2814576 RepID=UPI002ED26CEC
MERREDSATEPSNRPINRRAFLQGAASSALVGGLVDALSQRAIAQPAGTSPRDEPFATTGGDAGTVFPQSIASGGPTPSGVLLWTRLSPSIAEEGHSLGVEVATDESFGADTLVYRGVVDESVGPASDHTVTIDLDGILESDRFYHYRFVYDGVASETGRCRTLPEYDASPDRLTLAVLTCQDYQNGYYPAYHHLANTDVDYLLHLGDFIYEAADGRYRSPSSPAFEDRQLSLPSGNSLATTLEDFRYLHRTYRSDQHLQSALERHTLIAGWDDHEIANNRYWDDQTGAPVLPPHENGDDPAFATEVTVNGIQAWVEFMPERVEYDPSANELHERLQLWRRFEFGDLAEWMITDERLYRDAQPCPDATITCRTEERADRTMLGAAQKAWFKTILEESDARWTVWANEVLTMPLTAGDGANQIEFLHDSWDGYQAERAELLAHVEDSSVRNFISVTGDLHAAMAGYQQAGYGEVSWDFDRVGVELMAPPVTSANAADVIDFPSDWDQALLEEIARDHNEHLAYLDWYAHGYAILDLERDRATWSVYGVDKNTNDTENPPELLASYEIPDGAIELHRQDG